MKVTGIAGSVAPGDKGVNVGTYVTFTGHSPLRIPSRQECPYCHGPMTEITNCVGRISWQGRDLDSDHMYDVVIDPLPSSHAVVGCRTCKQNFTVLKEL